ncbi:hypothetical protein pb186bvf_009058 [Paramecium bursaria]
MNRGDVLRRVSCTEIASYIFVKMLGQGSYSEVFQGKKRQTGEEFAIKVVDKVFFTKQNKNHQIYLEEQVLTTLDHPGIIKCFSSYESSTKFYLQLELLTDGTLREYMKGMSQKLTSLENKLTIEQIKLFSAQILNIIEYIHQRNIVHRDLKPENLLITPDKSLKLIDFGGILYFQGDNATKEESGIKFCRKSSFVGTAEYISPELLDNNICGPQADLWALGCIIYEMITGKSPFYDEVEYLMFQKISDKEPNYENVPTDAQELLKLLLTKDPSVRLITDIEKGCDYSNLKNLDFFKGIDFNTVFQPIQIQPPKRQLLRAKTTMGEIQNKKQVLMSGIVDKESGMLMFTEFTPRKMQLVLDDGQIQLIYYNPYKKKFHTIQLNSNTHCKLKNDIFVVENEKKYIFKQREHPASQWVELINEAIENNKQQIC